MTGIQTPLDQGVIQMREEVTADDLRDAGVDLARDFPGGSVADFRKYPVLSEGGWFIVIKNQRTLQSVSRVPWRLLGPVHLVSDDLVLD